MTGPRPAGRPWTHADDDQLRAMLKAGAKAPAIAKKLKRTVGAIYARANRTTLNEEKTCGRISVRR
jgi:hypothetical protein